MLFTTSSINEKFIEDVVKLKGKERKEKKRKVSREKSLSTRF